MKRTGHFISNGDKSFDSEDLFLRRFKHTKLTHLAMLGAPLEVLARAGFQTSTISLNHYVNITEEAFIEYENLLSHQYDQLTSAFKGRIMDRDRATYPDVDHKILDPEMEGEVGSCASSPCSVFAPFGCYLCPRFEAFSDGAHELVLNVLIKKKERAISMGLPVESVTRDGHIIAAIKEVVCAIEEDSNGK